MQVRRFRPASSAIEQDAIGLVVSWHLLLPFDMVTMAGQMLVVDHGDWLECPDLTDVITGLLAYLPVHGTERGLQRQNDFCTASLWRIPVFHVVGLVNALLCIQITTGVFTVLVRLQTNTASVDVDSVYTDERWPC